MHHSKLRSKSKSKSRERQDTSSQPAHHASKTANSFQNPWMQPKGLLESGQVLSQFPLAFEKRLEASHITPTKVITPDFGGDKSSGEAIKATWLGHAGFMVEMPHETNQGADPIRILFDPIWSDRASPNQYAGPKRRLPPPCRLEDLPDFQFVVTSHNHYDHLDWPTIEAILKLKGPRVHFLVPLGNESWFRSGGVPAEQITQLDWWQEVILSPHHSDSTVKFICTPAQHGSGRGLTDQRATLWASWVVKQSTPSGATTSVYCAGDTGYMTENGPCPAFKEIGAKHGPFDLSLIPIWRGGSLAFLSAMGLRITNTELLDGLHASPAHAVRLHQDVRSRHTLGMHFATFAGSDIEAIEPLVELETARREQHVGDWADEGGFGTIHVGETAIVPLRTG